METLKFGNGNWATKEGSTLAYNDENNNFKPLPFDFTRASTATYVDSDGLIKTAKQGEARIDYTDSSDGVLLLEPARTNLLTYSEDFSQWTALNLTVADNNSISTDGTLNASKLTASSGTSIKRIGLGGMPTSSVTRAFSVFIKTNNINAIQLLHSGDLQGYANFDLQNNVVGSAGSKTTSKIENYGNGWHRCTAIFDSTNAQGSTLYLNIKDNANGGYGGDTSQVGDLYVFGAQLEQGSYATSYIPTNGSTVTRIAETASGSGNSEVFNDSEGVLFADIAALADDGTSRRITITDNSGDNFFNIVSLELDEASNNLKAFISSSTSITAFLFTSLNQSQNNKIALKYNSSSADLFVNGYNVQTNQNPNLPTGLVNLDFNNGKVPSGSDFYGKTKQVGYYDTILTDLELETLTSYTSWVSMVNELNLNIIYNG